MSFFKELLNVYWLRPETALLRAFDCALMEKHTIVEPSLDMGAGDGVLSYILAGGKFNRDFDTYRFVKATDSYNKGGDIYNVIPDNKYDRICDTTSLRHRFTVGVDHKEGLLRKALLLPGFYKSTFCYDLEKPISFKPEAFQTIFSNILYWLTDLDAVLSGVYKALRKKGRVYLFVPNSNFKDLAWIYYKDNKSADYDYLRYIDRGYGPLIKHCYSAKKWTEIFNRNGFVVAGHKQYLPKPVMEIWNIGTRPISHLLINMTNKLKEEDRAKIKAEWVEFFYEFLRPLINIDRKKDNESESAFHFFILQKH